MGLKDIWNRRREKNRLNKAKKEQEAYKQDITDFERLQAEEIRVDARLKTNELRQRISKKKQQANPAYQILSKGFNVLADIGEKQAQESARNAPAPKNTTRKKRTKKKKKAKKKEPRTRPRENPWFPV